MTFSPNDSLIALIRAGLPPLPAPADTPLLGETEWRALIQYAQRENLSALCYSALKNPGTLAQLPADLVQTLRLAYLKANVAHIHSLAKVSDLLDLFDANQIPVVVLKGVALSATLYADGATRQVGDLDLLIHPADKARVAALLQAHEFTPLLDLTTGFREELGSEQTYTRRGKQGMTADVHWHVINVPSHAQKTSVAWFWARTTTAPFGNRTATVFDWDAQLVHLAEHFVLHHQMRGPRWECDLALLLALHGDELHWDAILAAAREFQVLPALHATFTRIEQAWGVRVPDAVRAQVASASSDWTTRAGMLVATADRPDILLLREGLSYRRWRDKFAYLFHFFFPSPGYMQQRYRIAHPALVPFYYGWRLLLGAQRILVSLASIVRRARRPQSIAK